MAGFDYLWASLASGSGETAGGLLEQYGFFDLEVVLTPDQLVVADAVRAAMAEVDYVPHGLANQVHRQLRTGRLREALLALVDLGARQWSDNRPFWAALLPAAVRLDRAELLDAQVAAARRRCEDFLAAS
jgi:hypothetical protein